MSQSALRQQPLLPSDVMPEKQQREASDPKVSVWVGASAGSGKTTVLTNRVMRLLLDGVRPQKILCLTFTRAAAAEMANRVTEKLSRWATCNDDLLRKDLDDLQGVAPSPQQLKDARRLFARVLSCPGGMRIRTLHAFCQEILGRFPIEAGLPPHFAVIEEADAEELAEDAQRELLRNITQTPNHSLAPALQLLVLDLGETGFTKAMKYLRGDRARLKDSVGNAGSMKILIAEMRAMLELRPQDTGSEIIRDAVDFAVLPHATMGQAAMWLLEGTDTSVQRGNKITAWLALPPEQRAKKFDIYCQCFLTKENELFKNFSNPKLAKIYPDLDAIMGQEAQRLQGVLRQLETLQIAEITEAVLRIGSEIIDGYDEKKTARAALDYDDLIIRTNELLHRPGIASWVLYKLDNGLDHILVDEAQDTNRAQWSIIKILADEFFSGANTHDNTGRSVFAVGDEKQSIFSFQKAEPEAFTEMRDYFAQRLEGIGQKLRPVGLHVSFRSAPAILKAVDAIFAAPQAQAGVSVEPVRHFASRPRVGEPEKIGHVELWPLCSAPEKDKDLKELWDMPLGYEEEHDPQALLAEMIANKIGSWIATQEILPGTDRSITPGDIMILLRNRGRFADLMVRALKKSHVPVTGVDRMKLTRQLSVMDLLAMIQFALLPEDDLNLATVLRGPLLNVSEEQLMELAIGRKVSLWQNLKNNFSFAPMTAYLERWLGEADFITTFAFLTRILSDPCPGSKTSGRHALWSRLGPDALDPIEELLNAAQNFSVKHAPSMQGFLHWIVESDATIKRELDRDGDEVRIMTVHGAKGLEAPIVFLPDMTGVPRIQDVPKLLWSTDELPLYMARRPASGAARQLWNQARSKQLEEYRRLLYVALTRAAKRLYICGWEPTKKEANADECWYRLAEQGLRPLHESESMPENDPLPLIVFTDPRLRISEHNPLPQKFVQKIALPGWALQPSPTEPDMSRNLSPSAASPDVLFTRGRVIHRLLQSLPDIEDLKRDEVAARFLANPQYGLNPKQQNEIAAEVLHLLRDPAYAPLFGADSRAEVPMTGTIRGQTVARQVDRLCRQGGEIWIVDYKTNRPPPTNEKEIPPVYRQQLAEYQTILQDIYPGKRIRCFLLWTYEAKLMELRESA